MSRYLGRCERRCEISFSDPSSPILLNKGMLPLLFASSASLSTRMSTSRRLFVSSRDRSISTTLYGLLPLADESTIARLLAMFDPTGRGSAFAGDILRFFDKVPHTVHTVR